MAPSQLHRLMDEMTGSVAARRRGTAGTVAALTATLGVAAGAWVVAVRQMNGMDMGVATDLGSFTFFIAIWVSMMAAMMLPGAAPAVVVFARASTSVRGVIWMTVISIVVVSQKLLPAKAVIDVSLALAAIGLGILIVIASTSIPGLVAAM